MWQNVLVGVILAVAVGYALWRFHASFTGKASCCGGSCSCKGSCEPGPSRNAPLGPGAPGKPPCCPR